MRSPNRTPSNARLKRIALVLLVAGLLSSDSMLFAEPRALSPEDREAVLKMRRSYIASRANLEDQPAVIDQAVKLGKTGAERVLPLVEQDAIRARDAYLRAFQQLAGKHEKTDTPVGEIIANDVKLSAMRKRLLELGTMMSRLKVACGSDGFDPESLLSIREENILLEARMGPILSQLSSGEVAAIKLTNEQRAKQNLPPLKIDLKLCLTARDHSQDMIKHGFFSHTSPVKGKTTPFDRAKRFDVIANGENIQAGGRTAADAIDSWMNSPGHRANILKPSFRRIGVGRVGNHWTQMFGN